MLTWSRVTPLGRLAPARCGASRVPCLIAAWELPAYGEDGVDVGHEAAFRILARFLVGLRAMHHVEDGCAVIDICTYWLHVLERVAIELDAAQPRPGSSITTSVSNPSPIFPASEFVSSLLAASQSGGWGFCTGIGTTVRSGISK